ncbi:MAG: FAD-dependent monooxygenase [Burkholderiaceae bacterium]|nr:FAD-dependent monooxygenase [Burkholderiaceae bacterium]
MKIGIVGGGPSGLYLALLLKRRRPELQVTVFEQNRPDDTFGFGVVMADTGLSHLEAADKASHDALRAVMHFSHQQTICLNAQKLDIKRPGAGGGAITRIELLHILQRMCQEADVDVRFSSRLDLANGGLQAIYDESDLVVGADGVNSVVRSQMTEAFGTTQRHLHNRFAWYGTTRLFANPALVFREHEGGHFIAHYYRYSDTMSTFVAECDEATWFHCGLDKMSDDERQALFERLFAPELEGLPLVASNSAWRQFPVIRNRHWYSDKTVLIGDALSSAHFSIGSGTRIAMEDSIALAEAIVTHVDDVPAIGPAYEAARRPGKTKLIEASENSFNWYEDIARHMTSGNIHEFVYSFMTRTGRIGEDRLRAQFPELVAALEAGRRATVG